VTLEIDDLLHQDLLSAKLGDGYISLGTKASKACRVAWNMGNKLHALEKVKRFKKLSPTYIEKENPGFGSEWFCVATKSHPLVNKYKDKSFLECVNELNDYGLAGWYGDDGHLSKSTGTCFIHTECMSFDVVSEICEILTNKFKLKSKVHSYVGGVNKRKMHCIRLTKGSSNELMARTKDCMAKGMEYKNIYC